MKRNGGIFAGLVVLLTILGVSNLPKGSEGGGAGETKKSAPTSVGNASPSGLLPYSACTEITDRLRRFVEDSAGAPEKWKLPGSCYKTGQAPAGRNLPAALPNVSLAIATAPNPVSTHLPLSFDRIVEAIQQAAQDEAYAYDDSWLPWEATTTSYPLFSDQKAAEDLRKIQEAQPGVMVFRRKPADEKGTDDPYGGGLVVFVVGEKPTGGIDDDQFANAVAWIDRLRQISGGPPLDILGPAFSGSLPSLRRALDEHFSPSKVAGYIKPEIHVSSGTVSSGFDYQWFAAWMARQRGGSFFRTAMENDAVITDRFCQYLSGQGYPIENVAFLSEDETAFGAEPRHEEPHHAKAPSPPCSGAIRLYYPRDIATLRSAYEQQAILSPAKPQPAGGAPSTTLRGDLSEPDSSDHDTVRNYGGQLTPLAQEAILLDIANRLSEKRVQFIVVRSTSSLDQIFLSEFLRRSYPEGRVVIDGADLLFTRGAEGRSLRGVMLLSTYPLLIEEQDWTQPLLVPRTTGYRTFGGDVSEGVYIAAREMFRGRGSRVPILDYTAPAWAAGAYDSLCENERPATWLTVIGRRQFWPLAVLNANTLTPKNSIAEPLPQPSWKLWGVIPQNDIQPASPLGIPTTMWLFLIACAFWTGFHCYLCRTGSMMGSLRGLAYFAPVPQSQHPALIALGSLLTAMLAVVVAATAGLLSWRTGGRLYPGSTEILLWVFVLSSLALSFAACAGNYRLKPLCPSSSSPSLTVVWRGAAGMTAILCLMAFAKAHIALVSDLTRANLVPACWRAVNLLSGVSPLLPQVLFIAGAYLWFWCTLRGLAHFGDDRPLLPKQEDLPKLPDGTPMMPMFSRERAGEPVEDRARPLTWRYAKLLGVTTMVSAGVCWVALQDPWVRTMGERGFGILIFIWVNVCIAVVAADSIEMWRAWSELRQLLVYLDRLPLRRTLRALKGLEWGSIWKLGGNVLEERYRVMSFQLESLRHLTNTTIEWTPDRESMEAKTEVLSQMMKCQKKSTAFTKWYVSLPAELGDLTTLQEFQEALASTAGLLMKQILIPAWQKEKQSLIFDRSKSETKPEETGETDTAISLEKMPPHVKAAEEFFVLPYLAFIQNILGRLRTIALGGLWLFVSATLAVSSYPFDPLNVLGGIFLGVFAVGGGLSVLVYSQMSRDATLSHITNTRPGELGGEFWTRLVGFGAGPLIGLLTTLFPSITDFVFSWLQPNVQALN